jgi:integrase/recombinase XerD
MKLQSKDIEGEHEHRIYDEAKTPWQRVLLSGVLSDEIQQEWREGVESLDPLRLVQHVEALQRAAWRCAEGSPETTLVRFSLSACVSAAVRPDQREPPDVLLLGSSYPAELRDWSRSMDDPFLGEWKQIHVYVRARPMASAGEILREWQRRFPGRFADAHLDLLQRRLREIRAHLVAAQTASSVSERQSATASCTASEPTQAVASLPDAPTVAFLDPVSASSSLLPTPEEKPPPALSPRTSASDKAMSKGDNEDQHALTMQELSAVSHVDALLSSTITIDHAIRLFLQGEHTHNWEPKTREWHETSLRQFQRYMARRKLLLLSSLTASEIRGWLTFLQTEALVTGTFRVQSTISTYARSVHAFCSWLVGQGHLAQSPFARMPFPKGKKRRLHMIEQQTFERLLDACHAPQTKRTTIAYATARNRALLWVLWDAGLLVSEVCALNLGDVDLAQGILRIQGSGSRGRVLPLTPGVQQALIVYLEQHRLRTEKREVSDPLFLSEQRARLTRNGFTQLFHRLCTRAGLEKRRLAPTMLREMFAIRFLQTGGPPKALRRLLGLAESTPIKRYQDAAGCSRRQKETSENQRKT